MRRTLRSSAVALAALASLALPAGAQADPAHLDCTGVVDGGTYASVTVPQGQACYLSQVTVLGNATVEQAAQLELENASTVERNVLVGSQAGFTEDSTSVIGGTTAGNSAGALTIMGTAHSVLANATQVLGIQSATIDGSVVSHRGVFGGSITASVVTGNVAIDGTTGYPGIAATWFISGPQLDGAQQEIDGNVLLIDNQGPIYVVDNHIRQNLVCEGNTPPPTDSLAGETNTVDGRSVGQCAARNPGP